VSTIVAFSIISQATYTLVLVFNKAGCFKIRLKYLISIQMEQVRLTCPACEFLLPIHYVWYGRVTFR